MWRALCEILIMQVLIVIFSPQGLLTTTTTTTARSLSHRFTTPFYLVYGFLSLLFFAFRWRLRQPERTIWQQLLIEIEAAGIFLLELVCSVILLCWLFHLLPPMDVLLSENGAGMLPIVVSFLLSTIGFFSLRIILHVLAFWERLRVKRLRWAVTHSHLMVVVIGAGFISAVFVLFQLFWGVGMLFTDATPFYASVVFVFAMFLCTIFVIACVLPPSILSSYIFTRRVTRRIEHLAQATSMLRSGDYSIRVHVEGEDEIAHLQADFNAMASELERTMHALKEERDNVEMLLDARRELIASVSHELRTPVATVRSYLESALANWQTDQPPVTLKQDMHIIEQQTIRLQSLINDLFMLARVEVGRLETRCEPTNVETLVQRVVETIAPIAWRGSRIEVLAEIMPVIPAFPQALVDGDRLEQILHNLIHNGIRHTAPGGIIAVTAQANEQQVIVQVKDTGEGIAPEELARIWDRFYRASNAQEGSGTGLGLAIVKEFTEAMHGSVSVESVVGEGSCFTICFPRVQEPVDMVTSFTIHTEAVKTAPLSLL
ncbi:hypothetical protein KDW_50860 [Dictyobacter vulcani]|uniref:histidine kinase n=2 Tax=Dictyobacter vulcani TaxID=2607529 RepID=A0A5J4KNK9_9CHLR|nr:hypothetical protein KDW_50860 [Dictyobacter vulcani]